MKLAGVVALVLAGVAGLAVAGWMVYPPLGIAIPSAFAVAAGLHLDVEGS